MRPPIALVTDQRRLNKLQICFTDAELAELRRLAEQLRRPMSTVVRLALQRLAADLETGIPVARASGE